MWSALVSSSESQKCIWKIAKESLNQIRINLILNAIFLK